MDLPDSRMKNPDTVMKAGYKVEKKQRGEWGVRFWLGPNVASEQLETPPAFTQDTMAGLTMVAASHWHRSNISNHGSTFRC